MMGMLSRTNGLKEKRDELVRKEIDSKLQLQQLRERLEASRLFPSTDGSRHSG